jgi:hypothetical protein
MRRTGFVLLLAIVGCSRPDDAAQVARLHADSVKIATLQTAAAERDSLLRDVMETSHFVNDITTALGKARRLSQRPIQVARTEGGTTDVRAHRAEILAQIDGLLKRLDASEARLRAARARASLRDSTLTAQIDGFQQTITELRTMIDGQRGELAGLRGELATLQSTNQTITAERTRLADSVASLAHAENTVFYLAGTREELLKLGAIVETKGVRTLFGRKGRVLLPSSTLRESDFTPISKRQQSEIKLPHADHPYRLVSQQDVSALVTPTPDRRVHGTLAIAAPEKFWAPSRFLILVEER